MKKILDGIEYKVPATIDDDTVLPKIEKAVKDNGLGQGVNLIYEEDCENPPVLKKMKEDEEN